MGNPGAAGRHLHGVENVDDTALVGAALAGDRSAFVRLVEPRRQALVRVCARLLTDRAVAEDAAQETILLAWLSLARLREPSRFGPWLIGIGVNVCRHMRRRASASELSWEELVGGARVREPFDVSADPAAVVAETLLAEEVRAAVASLPSGQRAAVLLFYLHGLTHVETAVALGVEAGAVKTRLHKARASLRKRLTANWEDNMVTGEMVDARVVDVMSMRREGQPPQGIVALQETEGEQRQLFIWIGENDAASLVMQLERIELPRPDTHAFVAGALRVGGVRVAEVQLDRLVDDVFHAQVVFEGGATLDARPSDALNLALRAGSPIRIASSVLAAAGQPASRLAETEGDPAVRRLADFAAGIRERIAGASG